MEELAEAPPNPIVVFLRKRPCALDLWFSTKNSFSLRRKKTKRVHVDWRSSQQESSPKKSCVFAFSLRGHETQTLRGQPLSTPF